VNPLAAVASSMVRRRFCAPPALRSTARGDRSDTIHMGSRWRRWHDLCVRYDLCVGQLGDAREFGNDVPKR
jgi:hypothetical protein